ncbi:hypothetical protein ERO13_D05G303601v2 [Gossypium hirsutum]|nr:hypothetical protein ERO13_D05G303601v2 [Gossypium hirsutum]
MLSLQSGVGISRAAPYGIGVFDRVDETSDAVAQELTSSFSIVPYNGHDSHEDMHLALAHQMYKYGNYKQALNHSSVVYNQNWSKLGCYKNPLRTDNLLFLGAIYYQNEEAFRIEPHFVECYGNMENAWKEKGDIVVAIWYYMIAIEVSSAYMRKGRFNEAAQCCRQALQLNPLLVYFNLVMSYYNPVKFDAHSNLRNLMKAQGLVQEAYSCYLEALCIQPTFAIAWSNLAGLFMDSGDLNRAFQYYKMFQQSRNLPS